MTSESSLLLSNVSARKVRLLRSGQSHRNVNKQIMRPEFWRFGMKKSIRILLTVATLVLTNAVGDGKAYTLQRGETRNTDTDSAMFTSHPGDSPMC
jgi:hypothetical protein